MLVYQKKRKCPPVNVAVPADHTVKTKLNEKRDKYSDLAREQKKTVERDGDGSTNCSWCAWNGPKRIRKKFGIIGNRRKNRVHPVLLKLARILRRFQEI